MKKGFRILLISVICFLLSACGDYMPDLTEEEETAISEYAVELVNKHSKYGNNRLEEIVEEEIEEPAPELVEEEDTLPEENENMPEETVTPTESTTEVETTETEVEEVPAYSTLGISEIVGMDGIQIQYSGLEVTDEYEPGENSYFSITASRGKKLIVLSFDITNTSESTIKVDMGQFDLRLSYGNGTDKKKKLDHTMTAKDIYSYQGYLEPGQSERLIGVVELVESDIQNITEPVLAVGYQDQNYLLLLQ